MRTAINAGWDAWSRYGMETTHDDVVSDYLLRWNLYTGALFNEAMRSKTIRLDARVYANTRLIYKHVAAVVDFYASTVYQGDLPTDGKQLPDGSPGAIPIDPQIGDGSTPADDELRVAIAELWSAWNWKQHMAQRPMIGASLGDCLTELVDDVPRGIVYPSIVWPGFVTDIELDYVGNVKMYHLEMDIKEVDANGQTTSAYKFGKRVTGQTFEYFKDEKPFAYFGPGTEVQINPYGFCPAIWDRHKIGWSERGIAAVDSTRQPLLELNSLFSHLIDAQRRVYASPIIVKGEITSKSQTIIAARTAPSYSDGAMIAGQQAYLKGDANADLIQPSFDPGVALNILSAIKDGILEENPEASFYHELRQMTTISAPGAERALGDAVSRCRLARAGYDIGTIKLFQMALAMSGWRAKNSWARPLSIRQQKWLPYDLTSYKAGQMDFSIPDRPVVPPTEEETIAVLAQTEGLTTRWALEQRGLPEEAITEILDGHANASVAAQF